jgi:hypothetical protein
LIEIWKLCRGKVTSYKPPIATKRRGRSPSRVPSSSTTPPFQRYGGAPPTNPRKPLKTTDPSSSILITRLTAPLLNVHVSPTLVGRLRNNRLICSPIPWTRASRRGRERVGACRNGVCRCYPSGEPIGGQRSAAVFPNASRMASSIGATNRRDMLEPFTPAGAVSNGSHERETREPGECLRRPDWCLCLYVLAGVIFNRKQHVGVTLQASQREGDLRWGACLRRKTVALPIFEPVGMPTANEANEMIFVLSEPLVHELRGNHGACLLLTLLRHRSLGLR